MIASRKLIELLTWDAAHFLRRFWFGLSPTTHPPRSRTGAIHQCFKTGHVRISCPQFRITRHLEHGCRQLLRAGRQCPPSGVKRTWAGAPQMSAFDPKRTFEDTGSEG